MTTKGTCLEDYVTMIQKMDPNIYGNQRDLLIHFITMLERRDDFQISLDEITYVLRKCGYPEKRKSNLKRHLLDQVEDEDFKIQQFPVRGGYKEEILLSRDCFKNLCCKMKTHASSILKKYFFLAEERYREYAMRKIAERRKIEDPRITAKKMKFNPSTSKTYPRGGVVYNTRLLSVDGKDLGSKMGCTRDYQRREPEIEHLYSSFQTVPITQYYTDNNPLALEQCVLNCTPPHERSNLDEEVITTPPEIWKQKTKECDDFLTRQKLKYS